MQLIYIIRQVKNDFVTELFFLFSIMLQGAGFRKQVCRRGVVSLLVSIRFAT